MEWELSNTEPSFHFKTIAKERRYMKHSKFARGLVFGIALLSIILPILNTIAGLLEVFYETIASRASVYISRNNAEIEKCSAENSSVHAIGFDAGSYEEEYDDDEYEDKHKNTGRKKIGFETW